MTDAPVTVYYYNRRNLWFGGLLCVAALLLALLLHQGLLPAELLAYLPLSPLSLAALLTAAASLGLLLIAKRWRRKYPALAASREGLWLAAYRDLGTIPWSEIRELRAAPDERPDPESDKQVPSSTLLVELMQPDYWINQMPNNLSRAAMRLVQHHFQAPILLQCCELDRQAPQLGAEMAARLNEIKRCIYLDEDELNSLPDEDDNDRGDKYLHHQFGRDFPPSAPPQPRLL